MWGVVFRDTPFFRFKIMEKIKLYNKVVDYLLDTTFGTINIVSELSDTEDEDVIEDVENEISKLLKRK